MPKNKGKFVSFLCCKAQGSRSFVFSSFQERVERITRRERSPMRERELVVNLFSRRMVKVNMTRIFEI
jgi:hypothetical protein